MTGYTGAQPPMIGETVTVTIGDDGRIDGPPQFIAHVPKYQDAKISPYDKIRIHEEGEWSKRNSPAALTMCVRTMMEYPQEVTGGDGSWIYS